MKPHKKQTLFGFVGIVIVVFVFKMAGDYRYVVRKEGRYKVIKDTTYIHAYSSDEMIKRGHVNDTIK